MAMSNESLSVIDNRTGKSYEMPIQDGAVRAIDFRSIRLNAEDFGLMCYDAAFQNTASCRSRITYIDGDRGILRYRGYPIEQLSEGSNYLECAWLTLKGELPGDAELESFRRDIAANAALPASVKNLVAAFPQDAHPCVMLIAGIAALSNAYPDARQVLDPEVRMRQSVRLMAQVPTLAAAIHRHTCGRKPVDPDPSLSYAGNFLKMMFADESGKYTLSPALERALDVLLILHLDHEQNCSTSTMRVVASSHSDLFCAASAAMGALYGPLHGGANEEVLKMLADIGSVDRIPAFVKSVKEGHGRLMGFGHRVYKNYDPRARVIKTMADMVFSELGHSPLIEIAVELEKIALSDDYFIQRKLYPNVDFYSGLVYEAFKIPVPMFTVMFAVGRCSGWAAHYLEVMADPEQKIARPRQLYLGADKRDYTPARQP